MIGNRPKTLRITPEDEQPTDREIEVAIDIIVRAALRAPAEVVKRNCLELENLSVSGHPEERRLVGRMFLMLAERTAAKDTMEFNDWIIAHHAET